MRSQIGEWIQQTFHYYTLLLLTKGLPNITYFGRVFDFRTTKPKVRLGTYSSQVRFHQCDTICDRPELTQTPSNASSHYIHRPSIERALAHNSAGRLTHFFR